MYRFRPFILLGLAGVIGLITSVLILDWLHQQAAQRPVSDLPKAIRLAVASSDLPWGTKIAPEMVQAVEYPSDSLPEGHFKDTQPLVGRILVANLKRHEPILESKLAPVTITAGGVTAVVDPAKRAMAVRVDDEVGVAGFVKPGDRVDVLATIQRSVQQQDVETKVVLENTLVLAIGTEMMRSGKEEEPKPVKVITLEVTPEEAEKLGLGATEGKLRLALRSPMNPEPVLTTGATVQSLLASYRVPERPARVVKPRPPLSVELIKGVALSRVNF